MNELPARALLDQADRERKAAAEAITRSTSDFLKSIDLISASYLAQVLIALWDSGLYEYVRDRGKVNIEASASELNLDAMVLRQLIEYLVGRGLMKPDGSAFVLTERGRPYWNSVTRGALLAHLGGYNPLLIQLGPLLRREVDLHDPSLDRLERQVAVGSGHSQLGNGMVLWILDAIRGLDARCVLDLGCGAGDFLLQLVLRWPGGRGVGIDMSAAAIAEATQKAQMYGVADRVRFHRAVLSAAPMALDREDLDAVDVVTAMFMLHEFGGRGGTEAIVAGIASLGAQLPGRTLLLVEGARADPIRFGATPQRTYAQLDYSFIHPLSRQGPLRTPEEWEQLIAAGGARLLKRVDGFNLVPAWISAYVIKLGELSGPRDLG
jgi:SAM-dependent methyltransferase